MRSMIAVGVVLVLVPVGTAAQVVSTGQLSKLRSVFVAVETLGHAECLPTESQLRVEAELALRRAGLRVVDEAQNYNIADLLTNTAVEALAAGVDAEALGRQRRQLYLDRPHQLVVSAVAAASCATSYLAYAYRGEALADVATAGVDRTTLGLVIAYQDAGLLTGPDMPRRLREQIESSVTNLANEILKARQP